ncbi:MAG: hypothetical protein H7X86_04135 [Gorillibacterium sp.]|nr:hypothetical protein [Gorillibacterium sp.]
MNCFQVQEHLGIYDELPDDEPRKAQINEHIKECEACAEEYLFWKDSFELIEAVSFSEERDEPAVQKPFSGQVMAQIYRAESWRTPINHKTYSLPNGTRRKLFGIISFCLALFIVSFIYSTFQKSNPDVVQANSSSLFGFHQSASFTGTTDVDSLPRSAVASVNSMVMEQIKFGQFDKSPEYWIVFSLLGLVCALLIMNWLSRTHS